ncbi:hypothetical protein [Streptomyces cylindrosporus]|uniref:Uncharacterized protein n=1 Tax=Streptomyces cylindrosporus TaxID=2927583 RepID=A0ABS9YK16_9ACTN|nr:hypothetical protein [Streptomyces cylindrosporus]MCI3277596.1 hypothetical protein [Streptomyces cylindrosporus]
MTLAIDFDGVIHAYSKGWHDGTIYDPPLPGAIDGLHQLLQLDAVFIHTTREPEQIMPWLEQHGFNVTIDERCGTCLGASGDQAVDLDDRPTQPARQCDDCQGSGELLFWNLRGQLLVTNRKLPATVYLDDRAVRFESWAHALTTITNLVRDQTAVPRLLDCGWCYEEQGEEVHPHPECPIGYTTPPGQGPGAAQAAAMDTFVPNGYTAVLADAHPGHPHTIPHVIDFTGYAFGDPDHQRARRLIVHPSLAADLAKDLTDLAPDGPQHVADVQGRCPACRWRSLFVGDGGHITCSRLECPTPEAADQLLHGERITAGTPLVCTDERHAAKVTALEGERDQLATALREVLDAFTTLRRVNGETVGHIAEHPIHPDDMTRWRTALNPTTPEGGAST